MNEVQIISAYPSKSHFQRVLICAALSDELINIENYPECDDSLILINALIELGYNIELTSNKLSINSCPRKVKENYVVNCGESGFCSRVLPIIFSAENANFEFKYSTRMIERNLEPLIDILNQLKIHPILEKNSLFFHGSNNQNISIFTNGASSSQYLTALLFYISFINKELDIIIDNLASKKYIDLTQSVLESFSYFIKNSAYQTFNFIEFKGLEYNHFKIEGDWSGSSFFLILAAIKGNAKISNLNRDSIQPDKIILKLLLEIGANISYHDNNIEVCSSILSSFNFDAENYPDLVPALIPLGLCCNGTSKIINVDRINFKESRRIDELVKSYKILGASIDYKDNELTISKSSLVYSALDNKNDHRLAMSYAVAYKLIDSKLQLKEDQCVSKSYINFYRDLNKVQLYE